MTIRSWLVCGGASALWLVGSCAYPEFGFTPVDDDNAAGAGGATSSSSTVASSSSVVSSSSSGGAPGCDPFVEPSGCGEGQKCSVVDEQTGALGCVEAGPRPPWSRCNQDVECTAGHFCDQATGVCKPLCKSGNDCAGGGDCLGTPRVAAEGNIPGLLVCTANCHPIDVVPCSDVHGPTTCVDRGASTFDCLLSGGVGEGQLCTAVNSCTGGLLCAEQDDEEFRCLPWCTPVSESCGDFPGFVCFGLTPAAVHNQVDYGVCDFLF